MWCCVEVLAWHAVCGVGVERDSASVEVGCGASGEVESAQSVLCACRLDKAEREDGS
jgi:hypothetical protein